MGWLLLAPDTGWCVDIIGVQNAALDQPQINALLRPGGGGDPLTADPLDPFGFSIQGFLDTGASGVLLSKETVDGLGVGRVPGVIYEDVGVGGSASFNVSTPLLVDLAPFTPLTALDNPLAYDQRSGPLRVQINPNDADPLIGAVDVFGMPVMQNRVVVMDPKPLNSFADPMQTYLYNPGTPFRPQTAGSDPGIPHTSTSVALTFASFSRFSRIAPTGAEGPTQSANPFIGPNPLAKIDPKVAPGNVPGVGLKLGDREVNASLLLDTGAAASVISKDIAAQLGVRERPGALPGDPPVLERFDPAHPELPGTAIDNQFVVTLAGIGGNQQAAGFFLDAMIVHTREGNVANDNDPHHLRYLGAPVLVADISLQDPLTQQTFTLDGLFAMNFLVASVFFSEPFTLGDFNPSPFDWIVFDPQQSVLALQLAQVPEPATVFITLIGLVLVVWRLRRSCKQSEASGDQQSLFEAAALVEER